MSRTILETFQLTPNQKRAACDPCNLSVGAGAGAGKTNALTARYLHLVEEGKRSRGVAAITFTERAAREMRNRVRKHVHDWVAQGCPLERRGEWESIEANLDAARIGTIHSLCATLLRAHPAEAGVDPRFGVLDEARSATLQREIVEDTLVWATGEEPLGPLFESMTTRSLEEILSLLLRNRLQAEAAFQDPSDEKEAGRALIRAIREFVDGSEVSQAIDLLERLCDSRGLPGDAGANLAGQVQGLLEQWRVVTEELEAGRPLGAAIALFIARREFMGGQAGKRTSHAKAAVKILRKAYDDQVNPWLGGKNAGDLPPDPDLEARSAELVGLLRRLFRHALDLYGEAKDRQGALDYDDLEAGAQKLLTEKEEVRTRWQQLLDALLVDEFQDTNERQTKIIQALAGDGGNQGRLFVVGDPKQSIYRFRGADVTVFRKVEADIVKRGGKFLPLDQTFRAHAHLIAGLNEILANVMGCEEDPARPYYIPFRELRADHPEPRRTIGKPYIEFHYGLGENAEQSRAGAAQLLARRLGEMQAAGEIGWQDVACLFRASTGFPPYEAAFEQAGIPFVTVAGRGFYERPEIRDLLNILRAIADPGDDLAMAGLLRSPAFGLSDSALYLLRWQAHGGDGGGQEPAPPHLPLVTGGAGRAYAVALETNLSCLSPSEQQLAVRARTIVGKLQALVDRVPVAELLKQVLALTNYPAVLASARAGERLRRNVDKLLTDAHESAIVSTSEFLEYIETLSDSGAREGEAPAEAGGSVRLMSIHKAKGLEFPVVVLADAARGRPPFKDRVLLLPERGALCSPDRLARAPLVFELGKAEEKDRAEAEDLRLLYVAATRAQEKLIISAHQCDTRPVWFNRLCEAAGLDVGSLASRPGEMQIRELAVSKQEVGFLAAGQQLGSAGQAAERPAAAPEQQVDPIYLPIPVRLVERSDEKLESARDLLQQARRLTHRRGAREGSYAGDLFHCAVQRWCFPDDPRLDTLLKARALELGFLDDEERQETIREVKNLLARLHSAPAWQEICTSPARRHEVSYRLVVDGRVSSRIIDLLYCQLSGEWRIVDFKTGSLRDEAEMSREIESCGYEKQMQRYKRAVFELLGYRAEGTLCFLDVGGTLKWHTVA